MRRSRWVALALVLASTAVTRAPYAQDASAVLAANTVRRAAIVAQIGPRAVTVGELEDRLAAVPRYQLSTFGASRDDIARKFLDQVIVPDVLLALGAEETHLDKDVSVERAVDRAVSNATLRELRRGIGASNAISMDEVKAFYDENRARFDTPDRINVWRILCATREEAQDVLTQAKKTGLPATFSQLARDHSLDKATYMRGGNLGFSGPDGASNEPGIKVDPAVIKAAFAVKDGEIVGAPVPEGPSFAVVWRRGTVKAVHRSVEDATPQIRDTLWRRKKEAAEKAQIDSLRAAKVGDINEPLLGIFDLKVDDGKIGPKRRPGVVPPFASARAPFAPAPPASSSH